MASSKRSRAPRSKSPRTAAPKGASPVREMPEKKGSSPASAILSDRGTQEAASLAKAPLLPPAAPAQPAVALPRPAPVAQVEAARALTVEEQRDLVAKLAYFRAERRGFGRTNPVEDWLWAEQEVSRTVRAHAA